MHVLIVEDSEDQREVYATFLTGQGVKVCLAADGEEGLKAAFKVHPDVILMDLSLPGISGWELTRRLRADDQTKSIPIVVLTAHYLTTAEGLGCEGCIIKPCSPDEIYREILRVVTRGRQPRQPGAPPHPTEESATSC